MGMRLQCNGMGYAWVNEDDIKPSVHFVGHRQIVQIQIRRRRNAASDQGLHCLLRNVLLKFGSENATDNKMQQLHFQLATSKIGSFI